MHQSALSDIVNEYRFERKLTLSMYIIIMGHLYPRYGLLLKIPFAQFRGAGTSCQRKQGQLSFIKNDYYRMTLEISEIKVRGFILARGRYHVYVYRVDAPFAFPITSNPTTSQGLGFIRYRIRWTYPKTSSRILAYTKCMRGRACTSVCMLTYAYVNTITYAYARTMTSTGARAHSQTRGSPPFCTTSWNLGTASDVLVSPGSRGGESRRITRGKEYQLREARRKTGHSRLLSGFGWLGYLHLPKFTGGQCLAHFYGSITGIMS